MDGIKNRCRESILRTTGYGKFDYVDKIVPEDILRTGKPREILRYIAELLEIGTAQITYKSLHSWITTYRKNKLGLRLAPDAAQAIDQVGKKDGQIEKKETELDWKTFKPSEPKLQLDERPFIKFLTIEDIDKL